MILESEYIYDSTLVNEYSNYLVYSYFYIINNTDYNDIGTRKIHFNDRFKHEDNTANMLIELFKFTQESKKYVCFYVESPVNILGDYPILRYAYKRKDSYIIGSRKPFRDIKDIIYSQGIERSHIGFDCISTTYLNEIVSNKIEYTLFFIERGLMYNTELVRHINGAVYKHKFVKAPYSSGSKCAFYQELPQHGCYTDDLVIVQPVNKTLKYYELKCHCINGEIDFVLVKQVRSKSGYVCMNSNLEGPDLVPELRNMVNKYKNEIKKVCSDAFKAMNRLIHYRLIKLQHELNAAEYIISEVAHKNNAVTSKDKKSMLFVLTSLVNSRKKALIQYINSTHGKSIDFETFTRPIMDYAVKEDKYPTYDNFMRIDLALPDGDRFNKVMVLEVEPFASGRLKYDIIDKCLTEKENFVTSSQYLMAKIIKSAPDKFTNLA